MKYFISILCLFVSYLSQSQQNKQHDETIKKGNVIYDFTLADLSCKYIKTGDSSLLTQITNTEGLKLLYNHAKWSGNNSAKLSPTAFAKKIIDKENKKSSIDAIYRNLTYAMDSIASTDYPQQICLKYLPAGFSFSSRLCFTVGYDLGIVYKNNSSVNISHTHYLDNCSELKYYSIHELHHAGFVLLKKNDMPSLNITTYGEMSSLIAYFTHLEGMAVYAAYDERSKHNALNGDPDYAALRDTSMMKKYFTRYFEIYNHFLSYSSDTLNKKDWSMFEELSSGDRLWYRVGSKMAETIDLKLGRAKLTGLIAEPSEHFIKTYLLLKDK